MLFNRFEVIRDDEFWVNRFWYEAPKTGNVAEQFTVALHQETLIRQQGENLDYLGTLGDELPKRYDKWHLLGIDSGITLANLMALSTQGEQSEICFHNISMQAVVHVAKGSVGEPSTKPSVDMSGRSVQSREQVYASDAIALLRSCRALHKFWLHRLYEEVVGS